MEDDGLTASRNGALRAEFCNGENNLKLNAIITIAALTQAEAANGTLVVPSKGRGE